MIVNAGFHRADTDSWLPTRAYSLNAHPTFNRYEWSCQDGRDDTTSFLSGKPFVEKWASSATATLVPGHIRATVGGWGQMVQFLSASGSAQVHDDLRVLQDHAEGAVVLAGHPAIQYGPTLLTPKPQYKTARRRAELRFGLKFAPSIQRDRAGAFQLLIDRLDRTQDRDPNLQQALRERTIQDLHRRAEGETEYQAVFRYRLAMGALNLRGSTGESLGCPHTWCSRATESVTLTHILWSCDAARRIWEMVHRQWTRRAPAEVGMHLRYSLGPERPVLARTIRQDIHEELEDLVVSAQAQKLAWRIIQAGVPHQLWLHRNASAFNGANPSIHEVTAKIWATVTNQVGALAAAKRLSSDTYDLGRALLVLLQGLQTDADSTPATEMGVRLYYDGGSRGNPGVSGAGSLILERRTKADPWDAVWWTGTYLGQHSTNNVAEHTAVAQGLEEAARRYGTARTTITIIGDSMLATRQLKDQIRATKHNFASPIRRSRTALLNLHDYSFNHTFRTGNTAADWLANLAMDAQQTTTSAQCSTEQYRTTMTALHQRILNDTTHARSTSTAPTNLVTTIKALATAHSRRLPGTSRKRPRPISPSSAAKRTPPIPGQARK